MMCYFYNETHFGVLKKLSEKDFTQIRGFQLSPEITLIREFLNKHFYDFRVLSEIVKKVTSHSVKSQRKISLFEGKVTTYQYYAQQETISINYYDQYDKRQQINVSVDKSPLVIAKGKTERATLPNLVHNIDSIVLHSVVSRAKKLNIPLTVIHDCFIVHKKYENKIKQYYFESFCQEVFNSDNCVLTSFIKRNIAHKELIKDVKLKEILKELENRRRVFSLENYEMSPFILSE
jgi:hypothetical protein